MSSIASADRGGDGDIPIRRDPCQGPSEGVAGHNKHPLPPLPEEVWALVLRFAMARARRGGWGADVGEEVASEAAARCLDPADRDTLSRLTKGDEGSSGHRRAFERLSTIVCSSYDAVVERHRKHRLISGDIPIADGQSSCGAGGLDRVDFRLDVEAAFGRMDAHEVYILRSISDGQHLTEVAEELGVSYDQARTLLENARERLRVILRAYAPAPRPQAPPPSTN